MRILMFLVGLLLIVSLACTCDGTIVNVDPTAPPTQLPATSKTTSANTLTITPSFVKIPFLGPLRSGHFQALEH